MYNRLPKCGSATLCAMVRKLRRLNHLTVYKDSQHYERVLSEKQQENLLRKATKLPEPWLYHRHVHFLNFTHFGEVMPLYINLVRHPVDRFVSRFNFGRYVPREKNQDINRCVQEHQPRCTEVNTIRETLVLVPFFCGQQDFCLEATEKAFEQAKANVIKFYTVVGVLEQFDQFLIALECLLPRFFKGLNSVQIPHTHKASSAKISKPTQETRDMLSKTLDFDINFYNYLKSRFNNFMVRLKDKKEVPQCSELLKQVSNK